MIVNWANFAFHPDFSQWPTATRECLSCPAPECFEDRSGSGRCLFWLESGVNGELSTDEKGRREVLHWTSSCRHQVLCWVCRFRPSCLPVEQHISSDSRLPILRSLNEFAQQRWFWWDHHLHVSGGRRLTRWVRLGCPLLMCLQGPWSRPELHWGGSSIGLSVLRIVSVVIGVNYKCNGVRSEDWRTLYNLTLLMAV